ncbi:hypothetical protein GCM10020295_28610 [Streptomyces cinereospinus]
METVRDGDGGLVRDSRIVSNQDTLEISVPDNGGFAAITCPDTPDTQTCDRPVDDNPPGTRSGEINGVDGKCLDVDGGATADGTQIQLWTCNGTGAQQWQPHSDGTLRNPNSGTCLDAEGGGPWSGGTRAFLGTCHTGPNQKWIRP